MPWRGLGGAVGSLAALPWGGGVVCVVRAPPALPWLLLWLFAHAVPPPPGFASGPACLLDNPRLSSLLLPAYDSYLIVALCMPICILLLPYYCFWRGGVWSSCLWRGGKSMCVLYPVYYL